MTQHNHPPKPPPPAYESDLLRRLLEMVDRLALCADDESSD